MCDERILSIELTRRSTSSKVTHLKDIIIPKLSLIEFDESKTVLSILLDSQFLFAAFLVQLKPNYNQITKHRQNGYMTNQQQTTDRMDQSVGRRSQTQRVHGNVSPVESQLLVFALHLLVLLLVKALQRVSRRGHKRQCFEQSAILTSILSQLCVSAAFYTMTCRACFNDCA